MLNGVWSFNTYISAKSDSTEAKLIHVTSTKISNDFLSIFGVVTFEIKFRYAYFLLIFSFLALVIQRCYVTFFCSGAACTLSLKVL